MIVSVCVQAGQRKLADRLVKFFLGVLDSSMEIVRKILKFYISYSISSNWIISKSIILVSLKCTSSERSREREFNGVNFIKIAYVFFEILRTKINRKA